jgi:hypothetical protein
MMTDPLKKIDELTIAARSEKAPSVDVSGRVLASIREREPAGGYGPLKWIAVGSTIAATAMILSTMSLYETWSDPLNTLFFVLFGRLL